MKSITELGREAPRIKEQYPQGTRVKLMHMEDPYAPIPDGTTGTVTFVDDIGQVFVSWDNGRTLPLNVHEDSFSSRTVLTGSVSKGKNDPSQSLQMIERPLMTPDELKSMPKGQFVVMKTGFYPMKVKLKLFFKWGIAFEEEYAVTEHGNRRVAYAEKQEIIDGIRNKYQPDWMEETVLPTGGYPMGGPQQTRSQLRTTPKGYGEVRRNG